jgi:ABC-type methionine transport system permease subunit
MTNTIVTRVSVESVNEVDEGTIELAMEKCGADTRQQLLETMAGEVEELLSSTVFADADEMPVLDVTTKIQYE